MGDVLAEGLIPNVEFVERAAPAELTDWYSNLRFQNSRFIPNRVT